MESDASEKDTNVENIRQTSPYKEDPGALLEPGGKEVGDKDFLLSLSDPKSEGKPDNLLGVVIQEDSGRTENIGQYPSGENITNTLVYEDVQLHEAETEDEKETQILYKKVCDILNNLTRRNFNASLYQIEVLPINTLKRLQRVADLVFEKAVNEPKFSVVCANMCSELAMMKVTVSDKKEGEKRVLFKRLLITRCELEFEKNSADETSRNKMVQEIEKCTDPEKKKELQLMLEEEDRRLRRKSVGNVRFIGELFKKGMLTCNIMLRCLDNLLQKKDDESLECLCILLLTIGREFGKRKVSLDDIFTTMKEIVDKKDGKISSRVRIMLQYIIDLRSTLEPYRQDSNPKTMDQIQKETNYEQLKQHQNNIINSEEVMTSQSRGSRSTFTVRSDKLKNKPPQLEEPLESSQMFGQWCRGPIDTTDIIQDIRNLYLLPVEEAVKTDLSKEKLAQAKNDINNKSNASEVDTNVGDVRQPLPYKEDQWAPFNPEGKNVYDRDFLLALRTDPKSKQKPDSLLIGQLPAGCTITVQDNNDFVSHFSATKKLSSQCDSQIDELLGSSQMFGKMPSFSDATDPVQAPQEVNPEQLELKMKNILKEYLNLKCKKSPCFVFTYEQIHNILIEFFQAEKSFDDIISWIAANLGDRVKEKKFIRMLATAIFKSSIAKKKLYCQTLRKHYNLLRYFVNGTLEYELETLYALQAIINKLKCSQGLYLMVFTILYYDAILSHDSFLRWETSSDPAEQDGKDIALKQLSTFFTNIKKADLMEFSSEDD